MTATYAARDTATMLRRNLRHMQRYPGVPSMLVLLPVMFLLLFVYVFGATWATG
jgi:ABC-2 type transport system permease protein